MTDERSQDRDANSREYWKIVASNPGEHGHDEGGSRLMMRSHSLINPECWADVLKNPAKFDFDAGQAEELAAFFCRPRNGDGVLVVLRDAHVITYMAHQLKDAHVIAYRAHYWKLLDRIDEKQAEIAEMTAARKTATDGLPKIKEDLTRLNEELAALMAEFNAPYPASATADTASPPRAESPSLLVTAPPAPQAALVKPEIESAEARQDRRLRACEEAGLKMPGPYGGRLPNGVGRVADDEGVTRQAFSADLKAALKRRGSASGHRVIVHRA